MNIRKAIVGGLTLIGVAVVGYRTYELRKLRKEIQEEGIIDIEPEKVEELKHFIKDKFKKEKGL